MLILMKFYYKIEVNRYTKAYESEQSVLKNDYFESPSIQSAKSKVTRIANTTELFSWVQSWDKETRSYSGKDLRWRNWTEPRKAKDQDGKPLLISIKTSEQESGEQIYEDSLSIYGRTIRYSVSLVLYWFDPDDDNLNVT